MEIRNNNQKALIVLHEIYGINRFIEELCADFGQMGFDVFCPNMLGRTSFDYDEAETAYSYFIDKVGFDHDREIKELAISLKADYENVFLLGFSAGATIAWKSAVNVKFDSVVCCYGTRIRDYLELHPICPCYLIVAEETGFDVDLMIEKLQEKSNLIIQKIPRKHGFIDPYCRNYDKEAADVVLAQINRYFENFQQKSKL